MMSDLPQDLVEEILCRVPATSLKRLRSTCKQWNCLFNSKRFSRKHFEKAAKQFLFLTLTEKSTVCLLSINLHNGNPSVEVTSELSLNQVMISQVVFQCDGLLLCTIKNKTRILVWNPCTGLTKWIQTGKNRCYETYHDCVLGYYQDNKSGNKSYKILSYKIYDFGDGQDLEIYDINSNTWKNLDVTPDCGFVSSDYRMSLKGKTYWFGLDENEVQLGIFLLSFDYTTERFERLCLPYQCKRYEAMSLSVVKEEKLSVLLQRPNTWRREIWVTNKIDDETKVMSWSNLLAMENIGRDLWLDISVLVEEEKKVVCYNKCIFDDKKNYSHSVTTLIDC